MVEEPTCVDENIALVNDFIANFAVIRLNGRDNTSSTISLSTSDLPLLSLWKPLSSNNLPTQCNVLPQTKNVGSVFKVLEDLGSSDIVR